jgi:hypothetical protein
MRGGTLFVVGLVGLAFYLMSRRAKASTPGAGVKLGRADPAAGYWAAPNWTGPDIDQARGGGIDFEPGAGGGGFGTL